MPELESVIELNQEICDEYLQKVEMACSVCDSIHKDISELNEKIERLYGLIVEKSKAAKTHKERVDAWIAGFVAAGEIHRAACIKKNLNQICGVDLETIEEVFGSIKERAEFLVRDELTTCS